MDGAIANNLVGMLSNKENALNVELLKNEVH